MATHPCRKSIAFFVSTFIGRYGTKANTGFTSLFPRSIMTWNYTPSARLSTICANHPSLRMMPTHNWLGPKSIGTNTGFTLRDIAASVMSLAGVIARPNPLRTKPQGMTLPRETTLNSSSSIVSWAIWLIKRTYQPSLLRKKRQCGYMKRRKSVGGRRILKRRRMKGRKRLFGA